MPKSSSHLLPEVDQPCLTAEQVSTCLVPAHLAGAYCSPVQDLLTCLAPAHLLSRLHHKSAASSECRRPLPSEHRHLKDKAYVHVCVCVCACVCVCVCVCACVCVFLPDSSREWSVQQLQQVPSWCRSSPGPTGVPLNPDQERHLSVRGDCVAVQLVSPSSVVPEHSGLLLVPGIKTPTEKYWCSVPHPPLQHWEVSRCRVCRGQPAGPCRAPSSQPGGWAACLGGERTSWRKRKNPPRPLASIVLHCDPGAKAALAAATARSTSALKFWEYFFCNFTAIWQLVGFSENRPTSLSNRCDHLLCDRVYCGKLPDLIKLISLNDRKAFSLWIC